MNQVCYGGVYKNTKVLPKQWNNLLKGHSPIALFMVSQWRGNKSSDNKKCWFGCELIYKYSAN